MGVTVDRIIVVAFAIGAVLASVAGVAQGLQNNNIDFRMGFLAGLKAFTAGGSGRHRQRPGTCRRAHHDVAVTPDQYTFLESAFLLAAIVLGIGTIAGVRSAR